MLPEIHLGPVTIESFGVCLALALVSCGLIAAKRLRELGRPVDWAYESVFAAGVGGVVGAKLDWVLQNPGQASAAGVVDAVFGPGLVFYGGLLGGALAVSAWAWWRYYFGYELVDLAAPAIALGYALGGSAARSRATATTASPRAFRGGWPTRTARCRRRPTSTRRRSTSCSPWGS
jgi:phosphatidylglycerol---prolipoprotein diacylglyceryl transferase